MGCCESYSNNADVSYSSVTYNERVIFERILSQIPIDCRQEIINLVPVKHFLTAYQYHLQALDHLQRNEYLLAVVCEREAVQNMLRLLPYHDDHFIFVDMYKLLSVCLLEIGYIELSIKSRQIALNIILKYTPTDYTAINEQYLHLAFLYLGVGICKAAERCFIKTIEIARLCTELHQDYIQKVEQLLEATRERIPGSPLRFLTSEIRSNPGESKEDLIRRVNAELIPINAEIGKFNIDPAELKRLPDKQMELQITDEILNEVLNSLETQLEENIFLCKFGIKGGSLCFIAAYFKATQMKTSTLSPTMIEAALTIIINRINDKNTANDERYTVVKQSPFIVSYTDDDDANVTGVRMFQVKGKNTS